MAQAIEYKCPKCGGIVEFDSKLQKMKCPYCDSVYEISEFEQKDDALHGKADDFQPAASAAQAQGATADGLNLYRCKSCSAEIIADATTASMHCPYCGNPVILSGRLSGELQPESVIPFQLDKKAAKEALRQHMTGKKLLPRVFSEENHLDDIRGIYVPYWLYDSDVDADGQFEMKNTRMWSDSKFRYTETKIYHGSRSGSMKFSHVPVDASKKMPDDLMESLEPFDFSKAVPFKTAYLSGYFANRYDVSKEDAKPRAAERMQKSADYELSSTVTGYDSVTSKGTHVNLLSSGCKYVLLPVWILNTSWNGQNYLFAMNGQTGKFRGNLPMDKALYWKYRLMYTGIFGAALAAVISLFLSV